MKAPLRGRFATAAGLFHFLLATSLTACATQGTGQAGPGPGGDAEAGASTGTPDADVRSPNPIESGAGLDSPTAGPDAADASNVDATSTSGSSDSGPDSVVVGEGGAPLWRCPTGPFGSPVPSAMTPARVSGVPPSDTFNNSNNNFGIVEGPVWIGDALYLSEIASGSNPPASRVLKVTAAGAVSVAIADSGSNGLAVDRNGNLVGAVHKDGSISRFDLSTGMATAIASTYMGKRFDSPNDLAVRSDGNIYFSDPDYQAPSPAPQSQTRLYRIAPATNAVTIVDATLSEPNGVTLSLDESTLYVTSTRGVYKYPVMSDGSVGSGAIFAANLSGDGMTLDCAGNLYVTVTSSPNVVVFSPSGAQLGQVSLPAGMVQAVTNVAFGGFDHKTLYITALGSGMQKALFEVALSVPGMPY
ncbi:MAG: SMP-30/gluconolactonase/LRE family protein [Myxococcota bacterium]|nr:SMP-30/gluconolactonase/LRE family protein [Myxococcota bacterium]